MAASYSSAVESISDGIMVDQASFGAAPGSLQPPVGYERCDLTLHSVPVYRSPHSGAGHPVGRDALAQLVANTGR